MINYDFKNKVVLVTGSSRGIGKEVAYSFLKSGAVVILTGRKITRNSYSRHAIGLRDIDIRSRTQPFSIEKYIDSNRPKGC